MAALLVLLLLIPIMGSGGALAWPVVAGFGVTLALAALGVVLAMRHSRRGLAEGLGWDATLTLALTGAWTSIVLGSVYSTCLIVTCRP